MIIRDGGYWLFLPKPWRVRKIVRGIDRRDFVHKSKSLENILDSKFREKNRRISKIDHTRGQSLFVLPKVLSRGIHLWPEYESRLQRWLKNKKSRKLSTSFTSKHDGSRGSNSSSRRESLDQSSFYEEDPIRGFYTIWNFNSVKVPKNKLETTEKIYACIESISKSERVERQMSKPPRGGVSGLIEDPSCLSAKGRDTLQRWSRLASHYEAGQESGEDEDPIEMWNRAVETSILRNNSSCMSSASSALSQTTRSDIQSPKGDSNGKGLRAAATVSSAEVSYKERKTVIESAAAKSDSSPPKATLTVEKDSEKKVTPLLKKKQGCENRPTPYRPEAADEVAELRRKSGRIFALKSTENTPDRRAKEMRTPDSQKTSTPYSLRKRTFETPEASRLSGSASKIPSTKKTKKVSGNTPKNVRSASSSKSSTRREVSSAPQTPVSNTSCHVF
ncbi:unnamed protein product [Cylicocyclus nassatus]|uniref:Uncharacterized protein n=1 Tax=Cylicocyclus nassatus TaxID=53992 RepID=A0AA36H794_CYLNA|nr:unnamed protein product [Cylicocyclus nassatus]